MSQMVGSMSLRPFAPGGKTPGMVAPPSPLRVVFLAYPGVQALDVSGPLEIFARATRLLRDEGRAHPGYSVCVAALEPGPITASSSPITDDRTTSTSPDIQRTVWALPARRARS